MSLASASRIMRYLRKSSPSLLHVIDPFKISVDDAIQKALAVTELELPAIIFGSTDYDDFDLHMPAYLRRIKQYTDLPLITHFPPRVGRGFPSCTEADAVICSEVVNSNDAYYRDTCTEETISAISTIEPNERPELIRSAGFTIGADSKTYAAVKSMPMDESGCAIKACCAALNLAAYEIVYLYSRSGDLTSGTCLQFSHGLDRSQLLFASGRISSAGDVASLMEAGVDFVVIGSALESEHWHRDLAAIVRGSEKLRGAMRRRGR